MADLHEKNQRLDYLDSIRGIAAFVVVLSHCWRVNTDEFRDAHHDLKAGLTSLSNFTLYGLSKLHEAGRSCVMIFFVLSGFVLALSLLKKHTPYWPYVVKRVFRIYPTFLVVVLASWGLHMEIGARADFPWMDKIFNPDLSIAALVKHLLLFGTEKVDGVNNVTWSLVHEMRISLIFPIILWSVLRWRWRALIFYTALSAGCSYWFYVVSGTIVQGYAADTFPLTFLNSIYFIVFFAAGAYIAIERDVIARKVAAFPFWLACPLLLVIAWCLLKTDADNHSMLGNLVDLLRGFGAAGLIALALGLRHMQKALNHTVPVWLGRISYSLYLVHSPIIYVLMQFFGTSWTILQVSLVAITLSLIVAELTARFIEYPSIELGKKFSARFLPQRSN